MKVTGEKSLGSVGESFIKILFAVGVILYIFLPIISNVYINEITKNIIQIKPIHLIVFYTTGILALFIVYNFIGLFHSLKDNNPFNDLTVKKLFKSSIASLVIGLIYLIALIYSIFILSVEGIIFSLIISCVFIVLAIALYIISEIFKQANILKQENELTI